MNNKNVNRDLNGEVVAESKNSKNKNGNNRSRKGNRNRGSRRDNSTRPNPNQEKLGTSEVNDPTWYTKFPELATMAAKIPDVLPVGFNTNLFGLGDMQPEAVPAIAALKASPVVKVLNDEPNAFNQSMWQLYAYMRSNNFGAKNYEPVDIYKMFLAVANCYAAVSWATRVLTELPVYIPENRNLPKVYLASEFDLTTDEAIETFLNDFYSNRINYISDLNTIINQLIVFALPGSITFLHMMTWMFRNVYAESANVKDQLYMLVPEFFYKYTEAPETSEPWSLVPSLVPTEPTTFGDVISYIKDLVKPVLMSEDMALISGDVRKAYGNSELITMPLINPDATQITVPLYAPEILEQFKNAEVCRVKIDSCKLSEKHGNIIQQPELDTNYIAPDLQTFYGNYYLGRKLLVTAYSNPDANTIFEITRGMVVMDGDGTRLKLRSTGNYIISSIKLVRKAPDNTLGVAFDAYEYAPFLAYDINRCTLLIASKDSTGFINEGHTIAPILKMIPAFEYLPKHYIHDITWKYYGNFVNQITFSDEVLSRLNDVADLSMLKSV